MQSINIQLIKEKHIDYQSKMVQKLKFMLI